MREEARLKGKELQDIHVGVLKIFGGLNRVDLKMDEDQTNFSYKKCIGKTVYVSTKVLSDDSPIRIDNVKFISDIRENDLYESLNLVVRLDRNMKQTDEIALNHLLWMNGIESVFRDLLDDEEPVKRIQSVADILVFYHECLGKGRFMENNSYNIATSKERTSLVVTYIGNYLFDIHLERNIDYSELGNFELEQIETEKKNFFSFLRRDTPRLPAPQSVDKKAKSLFPNRKPVIDDFDNAVIAEPNIEKVDKIKKALDLKQQREREREKEIIKEEPIERPVRKDPPYTIESIDESVLAQVQRVKEKRRAKELEMEQEQNRLEEKEHTMTFNREDYIDEVQDFSALDEDDIIDDSENEVDLKDYFL